APGRGAARREPPGHRRLRGRGAADQRQRPDHRARLQPRGRRLRPARRAQRRARLHQQERPLRRGSGRAARPMIGLRRALAMIALAGLGLGAITITIVAGSDHQPEKTLTLILGPFVAWSFIGVGLFAWWRRPENRVGALMTAVGFAFFLGGFSAANSSFIYGVGIVLGAVWIAVVVHLLLAFP